MNYYRLKAFIKRSMGACNPQVKCQDDDHMNKSNTNAANDAQLKVTKTAAQWQQQLSSDEYHVCRDKGTEAPFSGSLLNNTAVGVYRCKCCGNQLFTSASKFNSGCGWPSFDKEIMTGAVNYSQDNSHGMQRIEVTCSHCDAHLGHIFPDGPTDTGQRFCINSIAMDFSKQD